MDKKHSKEDHANTVTQFVTLIKTDACINHRATIGQKLNPEKVSEASRHWRTKNPEKHKKSYSNWVNSEQGRLLKNASNAKRRAVRLHALPSWLTTEQLQEIKEIYKNCPLGYEVDHIIPLQGKNICGLHVPSNLQYLLKFDNRSKHNNWNPE